MDHNQETEENQEPKFSMRIVDGDEKSLAEREAEALAAAGEGDKKEEVPVIEVKTEEPEIADETVLSLISKKLNREVKSYEDLVERQVEYKEPELSEDLLAIKKFKEETGRPISEWFELQKDYDAIDDDAILAMYASIDKPFLSAEDLQFEIQDTYGYDEDMEEEHVIRRKKIAKQAKVAEARRHFTESKEKYKAPLESRESFIPQEEREAYSEWKQTKEKADEVQQQRQQKAEFFSSKTNELFSDTFEGFEFSVGDNKKVKYKVENPMSVKEAQMNVDNFISKHLNGDGLLKDAAEYHRSLYAGMNPDKLANFFYELGKSEAVENGIKESKQIEMKPNNPGSKPVTNGTTMKVLNPSQRSGNGLKVTLTKK